MKPRGVRLGGSQGLRHSVWACVLLLALPAFANAAQSVMLRYATGHGEERWQLRVQGVQVIALDATGLERWRVSPADGAAQDCDGVTQLALSLDDSNGDGRIDAAGGERARLAITSSWRHSAGWDSAVLVLDVSRPAPARRLWRQDSSSLPWIARLVAHPTVAPIAMGRTAAGSSAQVVLLGGGLPTPATPMHGARSGAHLLMLDAEDGRLRWRAAATGEPTQRFAAMTNGVSGAVTALDLDRDGMADRLYVGDTVATLWRFDVASTVTGGPIARLASPLDPSARSIIAAPDIALFSTPAGTPWFNIAVGTVNATGTFGSVGRVRQGLFVLRDMRPFELLPQTAFDAWPIATTANLAGGYSIDLGSDALVGRTLTVEGALLYTPVQGDVFRLCSSPGVVLVKVPAVDAQSGVVLADDAGSGVAGGASRSTGRVPRRREATGDASPFDVPRIVLGDLPALQRPHRRYWRREDAD